MGILMRNGEEYTSKPKLDKTLSIEGQAADAKAVGDTKISYTDVVDNLESTATDLPLSANMGKEIISGLLWKKQQITALSNASIAYANQCYFYYNAYEIKINLQLRIDTVYGTEISVLSIGSTNRPESPTALSCNSSNKDSITSVYVTQEGYINIQNATVGEYLAISGSWIKAENTI